MNTTFRKEMKLGIFGIQIMDAHDDLLAEFRMMLTKHDPLFVEFWQNYDHVAIVAMLIL